MRPIFKAFCCLALIFPVRLGAQVRGAGDSLLAQGNRMISALKSGNYRTFAHYMHPKLTEVMGGPDSVAKILTKELKEANIVFEVVNLDSVGGFIKVGTEWQATVRQHSIIRITQGRLSTSSTLICFSEDNGLNWTFVDTSDKGMDQLKTLLPNISPEIVIPQAQPPVFLSQ